MERKRIKTFTKLRLAGLHWGVEIYLWGRYRITLWGKRPFDHFLPEGLGGFIVERFGHMFQSAAEKEVGKYRYLKNHIWFTPLLYINIKRVG